MEKKVVGNSNLEQLLIFDFDQTITNGHMHGSFSRSKKRDLNSGEKNAVTEQDIKDFLQRENSGIKNKKKLECVLENALNQGMEVAIASFTSYPKAVEYVVKNHLGLTKEQAQSIKVVGGMDSSFEQKGSKIRKNLHVLYLLKAYKKIRGTLPQEVMLVDDDNLNVVCVNDFHKNVEELLAQDMNSILKNIDPEIAKVDVSKEELKSIKFQGILVSRGPITEVNGAVDNDYLGEVEKWIKHKKKKRVRFCEDNNEVHEFERNRDKFIEYFESLPPKQALEELQNSLDGLMKEPRSMKREIKLRADLIEQIKQKNKPQLWKRGAAIIAPPTIGLLGGLAALVLITERAFLIAALVAVVTTVAIYGLEYLIKPQLLEKPSETLKGLVEVAKNFFAKGDKTQELHQAH